jgi:ABC-type multidrug transport system ATPase subunit
VEEVMDIVGLMDEQFLLVGSAGANSGNGLSIEQRKRLSIAVELVANPRHACSYTGICLFES